MTNRYLTKLANLHTAKGLVSTNWQERAIAKDHGMKIHATPLNALKTEAKGKGRQFVRGAASGVFGTLLGAGAGVGLERLGVGNKVLTNRLALASGAINAGLGVRAAIRSDGRKIRDDANYVANSRQTPSL